MGRVSRLGGMVAACVWDHAGSRGPLAAFWSAVRQLDPAADDESGLAGAYVASLTPGHRTALREQCQRLLPLVGPVDITATAWAATSS